MNSKTNNPMTEIFNFMHHKVRVVVTEGAPWFVAVDLYDILYGRRTGLTASRIFDPSETRVIKRHEPSVSRTLGTLFKGTKVSHYALISESGLYKLIMRSDKPQAKAFQDWVTGAVLPAIRKDGLYVRGEEQVSAGDMDLEELTLLTMSRLQDKMKRLQAEKEAAEEY